MWEKMVILHTGTPTKWKRQVRLALLYFKLAFNRRGAAYLSKRGDRHVVSFLELLGDCFGLRVSRLLDVRLIEADNAVALNITGCGGIPQNEDFGSELLFKTVPG